MGSTERRKRELEGTRTKILDAARELFARDGYQAVTMRAIAERIEFTPPAIYKHFADKDALIRELADADFRALMTQFARFAREPDPLARLKRLALAYFDFALAHPNHYRLMFMTPRPGAARELPGECNAPHDSYAFLRGIVDEAIQAGLLRPGLDDADQVAQATWAALHGLVALHITIARPEGLIPWRAPRPTARLLVDIVVRGIAKAGRNK